MIKNNNVKVMGVMKQKLHVPLIYIMNIQEVTTME